MDGLVVLVVIDVLVSLSSVVTEFCVGASLGPDWEFVEPQPKNVRLLGRILRKR